MRAKESLVNETQVLTRTSDRQLKTIETMNDQRAALVTQLVRDILIAFVLLIHDLQTSAEKSVTLSDQRAAAYRKELQTATQQKDAIALAHASQARRLQEVCNCPKLSVCPTDPLFVQIDSLLKERTSQVEYEIGKQKRLEEDLTKLDRQLQKQTEANAALASSMSNAKTSMTPSAKVEELEQHNEDLTVRLLTLWRYVVLSDLLAENAQVRKLTREIDGS